VQFAQCARRNIGFTLVEMAVVVVIAGILLTLGVQMVSAQLASSQRTASQTALNNANTAMLAFFAANHRFPCPDTVHNGAENAVNVGGGEVACASARGTIPFVTMGLQKSQVLDAYGNFISYVIDTSRDPVTPAAWVWANKMRVVTPQPPNQCSRNGNAVGDNGPRGEIRIDSAAGVEETQFGFAGGVGRIRAVVVLISHGANGLGAWGSNGTAHTFPAGGSPEFANTQFSNAIPPQTQVTPQTYHDYQYSDTAAAPFDDMLSYITEGNLTNAGGTLYNFMVGGIHRTDICD